VSKPSQCAALHHLHSSFLFSPNERCGVSSGGDDDDDSGVALVVVVKMVIAVVAECLKNCNIFLFLP